MSRRGQKPGAEDPYHFSLGQTVSVPYGLWRSKSPGRMSWGNHVHVEQTLRTVFGEAKVSRADFERDPGYYTITSLSGHFPFQQPPACDLKGLDVDPDVRGMLEEGARYVPRLSAEEFNENFFVRDKQVPGRPEGTWWR